jgi:hypothetical protein
VGYYRFVPKFSKVAAPLHKLLKKDVRFDWNEEQENVFQTLKQKLISQLMLQYLDFTKEFIWQQTH